MDSPAHWKRSLWALWIANVIAAGGVMAMVPFLTFFVKELGCGSEDEQHRWAGILVGAAPLAAAVMGPVWGGIGDRYGRKAMVIRALIGATVFTGMMGFAHSVWTMLALRILQGVFSGFVPPSLTLGSLLAPHGHAGWVTSRIQSAVPAGAVAGFFLGGQLSEAGLIRWIFPVCSALAAAAAVIVALGVVNVAADRPAPSTERRARRVLAALASDARYVLGLPALVRFLAVVVVARLVVSLIDPNFARFVTEVGGDEETAGYVLSAEALMLVVFMPRWGRYSDRMGHRRTFALCAAGIAVAWMLQSIAADWVQVAGFRILNGIFLCGIVPAAYGLAARVSAVERRGSVMGVVFLCIALSHALGSMLGGGILNLFGFRTLMRLVAGLLLALAGYALWDSVRSRRAERLRHLEPTKAEASV